MTNSRIESEYRARTRGSLALYGRARQAIPAGLTHDSRTLLPYPIYAARASGARKWDVDGREYVDYFGGHGAPISAPRTAGSIPQSCRARPWRGPKPVR